MEGDTKDLHGAHQTCHEIISNLLRGLRKSISNKKIPIQVAGKRKKRCWKPRLL